MASEHPKAARPAAQSQRPAEAVRPQFSGASAPQMQAQMPDREPGPLSGASEAAQRPATTFRDWAAI